MTVLLCVLVGRDGMLIVDTLRPNVYPSTAKVALRLGTHINPTVTDTEESSSCSRPGGGRRDARLGSSGPCPAARRDPAGHEAIILINCKASSRKSAAAAATRSSRRTQLPAQCQHQRGLRRARLPRVLQYADLTDPGRQVRTIGTAEG